LPPPPLRSTTGSLPPPRAQTGKLPLSAAETPAFRSTKETGEIASPDTSLPAPSSANVEKSSVRPSVPLPDFKPLFGYDKPNATDEPAEDAKESAWFDPNTSEPISSEERTSALGFDPATLPVESTDLPEESAKPEQSGSEDDESRAELETLRRHLEGKKGAETSSGPNEELALVSRERDEARMEVIVLRHQLETAEQTQRDTVAMASQLEELSHVIDERDSVRRDYATLRDQFETLKLDRSRGDSSEATADLEAEIQRLREQLVNRPSEKSGADDEPVSADVATLREELKKAKEEASLASRGLALSQKALQETRDALRDASEGTAGPKGGSEDFKKERATLSRQNMLLQGQNDQLNRELSAAKAKLAAKGG
jgi:hypothetical protein